MARGRVGTVGVVAVCLLAWAGAARAASDADEKAVWDAWKVHQNPSNDHAVVVAACQQAQKADPTNPLQAVIRGIQAWHLLKMGQTNEAVTNLQAMLVADPAPVGVTGAEMARRWLSRVDRERVRAALQALYLRDIAYPKTLEALGKLPPDKAPPLKDRWGAPWNYELADVIKGLTGQRYRLQCKALGVTSDIKTALELPYGERIKLKPVALSNISGGKTVKFEAAGDKPVSLDLSEGAKSDLVTFAYAGSKLLVLTDGDHWLVAIKPAK